jgi:hypothetical protein
MVWIYQEDSLGLIEGGYLAILQTGSLLVVEHGTGNE